MKLFNMYHFPKYELLKTSSVDGLSRSSKARPKATLPCKKKNVMVTVWQSAARTDSLQLSESQWNYYIWEACLANQWDALKTSRFAASIGQQKGSSSSPWQCPTSHHTTDTSKVEWIGLWHFASPEIFTWPLANWPPLLQASWQLFVGKMLPQPAGCKKCCPRICHILKHRFFFYLWWILSYIEMKQPWVYMCSPSFSPPPSPPAPSRSSQCTRSERLSHASNLGWWSVSP